MDSTAPSPALLSRRKKVAAQMQGIYAALRKDPSPVTCKRCDAVMAQHTASRPYWHCVNHLCPMHGKTVRED